jgi:ketosteroid isomerase-like protein
MSRRHAEIVRRVFEGVEAVGAGRDPGEAFDAVAEDFVLVPAPEVPGLATYRGMAGFMEFMRTWTDAFETWSVELGAMIDPGGDRIVALMHQSGTGKGSGAPVDLHYAGVHRFEDGRLAETRLYMSAAEAVEAAGSDPESLLHADRARAFTERGVEGVAETWHEDVVYEEDPLWPGAGIYRGREAVVKRLREYEEQLGRSTVTVDEIVERAAGAVVIFRNRGVTPSAGLPFEHRWAWLVQTREGKAVHIRAYFDPDEALRTAGDPGA